MEPKWKPNCCCGCCRWWWYGLDAVAAKSRGRPLPRFMAAPTADAGVYCPAATAAVIGTDAEIGVAFSGRIRLPSGPYFLGLPLFFPTFTTGLATGYPPPPTTPAATTAVA